MAKTIGRGHIDAQNGEGQMVISTASGFQRALEAFAVLAGSISFFSGGFCAVALVRYATPRELAESVNVGIGFGFMVGVAPFLGLLVAGLLGA